MEKRIIHLGNLIIGGNHPIVAQTMLKCKTSNLEEAIEQINLVISYKVNLIRVAVLDVEDALAIKLIKDHYANQVINIIADIHFDYQLALLAIENGADKIRLNPSNLTKEEQLKAVVNKAKEKHIPIRIGINGGSLYHGELLDNNKILALLDQEIKALEKLDFYDIVLSAKLNNLSQAIEINKIIDAKYPYPLHLGLTEAGSLIDATIKSAIFLHAMKESNIGSTVRVSLNGPIQTEVTVLKRILINLDYQKGIKLIICPSCGRLQFKMDNYVKQIEAICYNSTKVLVVAFMGCIVNGPGEARGANIAIVGGVNNVSFYLEGKLTRVVAEDKLIATFVEYLNQY
ncbi:MAG: flavodoxin-dependent (E)-4-hydroxy-3-methylbut-2-enyl-diphosphate synthase [Acholeplasmatales bacterium]|nr:flavodoxin-dependent (E)-4-hydroxy-3-methylbut-2-enyl-diphosphate synthase [Acholeplasmatales bacterium]